MKQIFTLFLLSISLLSKAGGNNNFWTLTNEKTVSVPGERKIIPFHYQLAKLDVASFQLEQAFIPTGFSTGNSITLPTPDGGDMEFYIYEEPMMEMPLANKYPQIKTYTGIAVNDARVIAKIDFTLFGFHAMVMDGDQTYFIDPYTNMNTEWYVVYYKSDFAKSINQGMHCHVDESNEISELGTAIRLDNQAVPSNTLNKTSGDTIRTYRLALACTEEYSAAVGGATPTKASVLSAMVTSMNRCNGVFEKDFSMHANLVGNDDTLIYLPGSGDPYTNSSGSNMLGENQSNVNARIGTANYDYGHVFSTGGGGVASLACVCNSSSKAQGVTGSSNPVGDPFDIDYVVHEMGHQFGGSHTFNSVTGSCSGNRSSTSAYEIGSGTTIMAYAGICGSDDIQPHSDDYYHVRSLEQMTGNSVKTCAVKTLSGNTPPVLASISKTYIIPYKTPFELTATATDANADPLTYCWEQYNRGGSGGAWDAATKVAPILRTFNPSTSGTRVFPQYKELIKNTEIYLGERLPDTARVLTFRCTVRDMHNGHGAFYSSTDSTKLDVRSTSTLFRVTSQNSPGLSWQGFSTQTITWNVAGTNAAPVAAANVNIYLSIDSGKTWPYVLAAATPNDGSQVINVPNVAATWARVKVKGDGNVFFDLNDNWIEIKKVVSPSALTVADKEIISIYPNPSKGAFTVELPSGINKGQLLIFNTVGAQVFQQEIDHQASVHVNGLAKGIYMVKVLDGASLITVKKVVIE